MPDFFQKLFGRQSQPRSIAEDTDLTKFYTDTVQELQLFEQFVTSSKLPKRVLVIHGLGGVGKSTLLKMYVFSARKLHVPVALVASEEALSPVDLLAGWAEDLSEYDIVLPAFQKALNHYRAIQAKVEAEAKNANQATHQLGSSLGKTAAKTAISIAASAIPIVGPIIGSLGGESAEAVLDWLNGLLSKPDLELYLDPAKRLDNDFLADLTKVASRRRHVLMTDTYEQMTALDDWMREMARRLPANVLLVIASRTVPEWNRHWQEWMGKAEIVELKEMTPENLRTLVHRYYSHIRSGDPDPKQVEAIVQFARGLPMAATTVVQLWVKFHADDFQTVRPRVVADLADRLLEGVPQEMRPIFEVAAVLRYFNVEALEAMLEDDKDKAEWVYTELRRWPFIRSRREGLAMHDTMREVINGALRLRTPKRFQTLHEKAVVYYATCLETASGDERDRCSLELLYHQVMSDEKVGITRFRKSAEDLVRYQLPASLNTLLNDVNNYPLQSENSQLWREYYQTRLKEMEGKTAEVVEVYQGIAENEAAEETLRAYASCDWAWISRLTSLENMRRILERISPLIPELESLPEPDAKIGSYFFELADLYRREGKWSEVFANIERARSLYERIGGTYGLATSTLRLANYYLERGMWKEGFSMQEKALQEVTKLKGEQQQSNLRAELLGGFTWFWAGRYYVMESRLQEALKISERFRRIRHHIFFSRDLELAYGLQGKLQEAERQFAEGEKLGKDFNQMDEVYLTGFQGIVALKWAGVQEAERYLTACMTKLNEIERKDWHISFFLNLCGTLYEIKREQEKAEKYYQDCLKLRKLEQWYWQANALTGLARISLAKGDYAGFDTFLHEAEELSQQYEYNDLLASLRLIQGHHSWDAASSEEKADPGTTLHFYQQALIYALRYNRFLLDDALSGRPQGTPFEPIILYCLKRGSDGERILRALYTWWREGNNSVGQARTDSISPNPEGVFLPEGETLARQKEPGDGTAQKTVLEQLAQALTTDRNA